MGGRYRVGRACVAQQRREAAAIAIYCTPTAALPSLKSLKYNT